MTQRIELNRYRPDPQGLAEIDRILHQGGVIAYPTDSGYALGCLMGSKKPLETIKAIRQLDNTHNFTIICRDLAQIANFAKVNTQTFRLLKKATPGHYTFILPATSKVPVVMMNKSKKTIGIRIPDHEIPLAITEQLKMPLLSSTFILPDQETPVTYLDDIPADVASQIDCIVETDYCGMQPTTVVDMTLSPAEILRVGGGSTSLFD